MIDIENLWQEAIREHNSGEYHEAHELFEDLWLELDDRKEKDTVQTLAQADALAVHLQTGNLRVRFKGAAYLGDHVRTWGTLTKDQDSTLTYGVGANNLATGQELITGSAGLTIIRE